MVSTVPSGPRTGEVAAVTFPPGDSSGDRGCRAVGGAPLRDGRADQVDQPHLAPDASTAGGPRRVGAWIAYQSPAARRPGRARRFAFTKSQYSAGSTNGALRMGVGNFETAAGLLCTAHTSWSHPGRVPVS